MAAQVAMPGGGTKSPPLMLHSRTAQGSRTLPT
ncbi:MAG: hypothetical protein ACI8X5_004034, partial [Planctomycetota bacterium]